VTVFKVPLGYQEAEDLKVLKANMEALVALVMMELKDNKVLKEQRVLKV